MTWQMIYHVNRAHSFLLKILAIEEVPTALPPGAMELLQSKTSRATQSDEHTSEPEQSDAMAFAVTSEQQCDFHSESVL